jgi:RNA polymerase sigma factor (sigma-70 family)
MQQTQPIPLPEIDDRQAVNEVVRGNREMFEVIVRRYNQLLYRLGMSYLRQHEQVEDAMQNAYLKCYLNLRHFRGGSSFSTWLCRVMINECLMQLRRRKTGREELFAEQLPEDLPDHTSQPGAATLNSREMKILLETSISELPRKYRAVYMLREVQQLTTTETARTLGITKENVKVTLHRAREMLKARLLQSAAGLELFPYHAPFCNRMTAQVMARVLATS